MGVKAFDTCIMCRGSLHYECMNPAGEDSSECCCPSIGSFSVTEDEPATSMLRDPLSTGRKQAARLYPISEGMLCEWSGLANAGGGVFPIIGCSGTVLEPSKGSGAETGNIHHGPDKNVLNNTDDNISRICTVCHNRWHGLNDPYYGKRPDDYTMPFLPTIGKYSPLDKVTLATPAQVAANATYWAIPDRTKKEVNYTDMVKNAGLYGSGNNE